MWLPYELLLILFFWQHLHCFCKKRKETLSPDSLISKMLSSFVSLNKCSMYVCPKTKGDIYASIDSSLSLSLDTSKMSSRDWKGRQTNWKIHNQIPNTKQNALWSFSLRCHPPGNRSRGGLDEVQSSLQSAFQSHFHWMSSLNSLHHQQTTNLFKPEVSFRLSHLYSFVAWKIGDRNKIWRWKSECEKIQNT